MDTNINFDGPNNNQKYGSGPSHYYPVTSGSAVFPSITNLGINQDLQNFPSIQASINDDELRKAHADYISWKMGEHKKQFIQQRWMGILVFIIVMALVISGLAFSWVELSHAIKANVLFQNTEVKISTTEIFISSSIVGGIVLIVSVAFFYLFLKFGYNPKIEIGDIASDIEKYYRGQKK